jgi:hypothetical protein
VGVLSWDFTVRESQIRSISFCLTTDGLTRVGLCRIPASAIITALRTTASGTLAHYRFGIGHVPYFYWCEQNFDYMEIDGTGWSASGPVRDRGVQQEKDESWDKVLLVGQNPIL